MAEQKVFAGPRVKRFRISRDLSQTAMAKELGVSPSYLNLIERNQRPLTVQLILKLSSTFKITADELLGDTDGTVDALKGVFSDSLLDGELPGYEELFELADVAPNVTNGILKLHAAYREALEHLSEVNKLLAEGDGGKAANEHSDVHLMVANAFATNPYFFEALEVAAEEFVSELDLADGLWAALQAWLRKSHHISVQTLPVDTMPEWRRRFDKHTMRLFISDRLSHSERIQELGAFIAQRAFDRAIESALLRLSLKTKEAQNLAKLQLAEYASLALMMPYRRFFQTARRNGYDLTALKGRFDANYRQVALRLCSMVRTGMEGVNFTLYDLDFAGNTLLRRGSNGSPPKGFDVKCPKLLSYRRGGLSDDIAAELVQMPNNTKFLTLAKTVSAMEVGYGHENRRSTILLVCSETDAEQTTYSDVLKRDALGIGPNCRLCERGHCARRVEPPVTRPADISFDEKSISNFQFKI